MLKTLFFAYTVLATNSAIALPIWDSSQFKEYAAVDDSLIVTESAHHDIAQEQAVLRVESTYRLRLPKEALNAHELLLEWQSGDPWSDPASVVLVTVDVNGVFLPFAPATGANGYLVTLPADTSHRARLHITYTMAYEDAPSLAFNELSLLRPGRLIDRNGSAGWDVRALSEFSSDTPTLTSLAIKPSPDWFALASGPLKDGRMAPRVLGNLAVFLAKQDDYAVLPAVVVNGTHFDFVTRKIDPVIDRSALYDTVADAWPKYESWFGRATDYAAVIEQDGNIGAGPIGSNMLGIVTTTSIPPDEQAGLRQVTGWTGPLDSTDAIIKGLYVDSPSPIYEFFSNILTHELGHLYFGFGMTQERRAEAQEFWLSLGLGIVYDSMISTNRFGREPALYQALAKQLAQFEANPAIDQHLIDPDTSRDLPNGVYPFNRVQDFAHLRSTEVLRTLRADVGPKVFDRLVKRYLHRRFEAHGYDTFRPMLERYLPNLMQLERDLRI